MAANQNLDRVRQAGYRDDMTEVIDSIRVLVKALRDSGRDVEQKLGVTPAQLYVLEQLRDRPASINELAERTYTHQSSVSMVVARLIESRLVARSTSRTDARKVSISLTTAGKNLLKRSPGAAQARLVSALKAMPRADLKSLSDQLLNLTAIMEKQEKLDTSRQMRSVALEA